MRRSEANSAISSEVRSDIHASIVGSSSSRRNSRHIIVPRSGSPGPVGTLDHGTEIEPLLPGDHHEPDVAVFGRVDTGEHHHPGGDTWAAGNGEVGGRVHDHGEAVGLERADVDQLTRAPPVGDPAVPRREVAHRGDHARFPIPDPVRRQAAGRCRSCRAARAPGPRLERGLGRRLRRPRPVEPEGRDGEDGGVWRGFGDSEGGARAGSPAVSRRTTPPRGRRASSSRTRSRSSARSGSTRTDCFEQARNWNTAPSSSSGIVAPVAVHRRSGSPSGSSTLITVRRRRPAPW